MRGIREGKKWLLVIQSRHKVSSVLSHGWQGKADRVCVRACGLVSVCNRQKKDSNASSRLTTCTPLLKTQSTTAPKWWCLTLNTPIPTATATILQKIGKKKTKKTKTLKWLAVDPEATHGAREATV